MVASPTAIRLRFHCCSVELTCNRSMMAVHFELMIVGFVSVVGAVAAVGIAMFVVVDLVVQF
jgi:hypothetical protein